MNKSENYEAVAFTRYIRMSPFKLRRILDQIRGRSYRDALLILKFMPYNSCPVILKTLLSASANAKVKFNAEDSSLYISEARVDSGPQLKRFRPHAQGRGFPIKKRMSHLISAI